MQVLRVPPYPITITYDVPSASTAYILVLEDPALEETQVNITSNANKKISYQLTGDFVQYDASYTLSIYENDGGELGDLVVQDSLEVYRPYVDPNTLASTASEIATKKHNEFIARSIIDSIVDGFYYEKTIVEHVGLNTDYAPLQHRTNKILKVYQNNELWYDSSLEDPAIKGITYSLSDNGTAIVRHETGIYNRADQAPLVLPTAQADWMGPIGWGATFNKASDFTFVLATGYKVVPLEIKEATLMLIDDLECGKLDYYKRYVTQYNTDQFRLAFDKRALDGTGNIVVDQILSKYIGDSRIKIGVL